MKRQVYTRTMAISIAGAAGTSTSINLANCRLIGCVYASYASFTASSQGQGVLTRTPTNPVVTNSEGVLLFDALYAPINGTCGSDRTIYVPLDFTYKFPEPIYLYVTAGAGCSYFANVQLYLEQL